MLTVKRTLTLKSGSLLIMDWICANTVVIKRALKLLCRSTRKQGRVHKDWLVGADKAQAPERLPGLTH